MMYGPWPGPPAPPAPPPSGGLGLLVGTQTQFHNMTAWDVANRERDEYLQELYDAQNVAISLEEDFDLARQEDNRLMARLALRSVPQQNPIQLFVQHLSNLYQQNSGSMLPYSAQQLLYSVRQSISIIYTEPTTRFCVG